MVVFFPVRLLSGLAKFLFAPQALTVFFAVVASFLIVVFFVPVASLRTMRQRTGQQDADRKDSVLGRTSARCRWLRLACLRWRWIVVGAAFRLFDRLQEGATVQEAIVDAAVVRFRPILMTSVTTILALTPMAIGLTGGEADVPLARTIVGGVIAATLLPKFVVPCLHVLIKRLTQPADEPEIALA